MSATFFETALEYHAKGFNVVPVVPGQKFPPKGAAWSHLRSRRQTPEEVAEWATRYPAHDIALILGSPHASVVDVEFDGPDGPREVERQGLRLPDTAMFARTKGRGAHRLYSTAAPCRTVKPHPQVEVRGAGSLAVVPPSRGRYWISPLDDVASLPALPEEWSRFVRPDLNSSRVPVTHAAATPPVYSSSDLTALAATLKGAGKEAGEILREMATCEAALPFVAPVLGLPDGITLGSSFCCPLPKHDEWHPSAQIYRGDNGVIGLRDWHRKGMKPFYSLPEVHAAIRTGGTRWDGISKSNAPLLVFWSMDLYERAGLLKVSRDILRAAPEDWPWYAKAVREEVDRLFALRWHKDGGAPAPMTWDLLSALGNLPIDLVRSAMCGYLLKFGFVEKVGEHTGRFGHTLALFMPGNRG
ncbi:MAG TPA: bifunctional DNA primase/polymerase [bacterium]|nr:bifunctional DNA primase/polymerase [bacterium]